MATKTFGGHYNYKLLKRFRDNTVFHGLHCGVRLIWVMQIFVKEIGQPPPPDKRSPLKASGGLLSPQSEKKQQQTIWAWTWSTPLKMDDCVPGIGWGLTVHDPICLIGHTFLLFYFKCFFSVRFAKHVKPVYDRKKSILNCYKT